MAISVTSIGTNSNTTGATLAIASVTVPSGALIVVGTSERSTTGVSGSLADGSNTYTSIAAANLNNSATIGRAILWYAKNTIALSSATITYTKNGSTVQAVIEAIYATGIDTAAPLDTPVTASATGSTGPTVTSGTPSVAGDLVVGFAAEDGTTPTPTVASSPWSTTPGAVKSSTAAAGTSSVMQSQVLAGSSAVTYTPTNMAANYAIFVAGFKADVVVPFIPQRRRAYLRR